MQWPALGWVDAAMLGTVVLSALVGAVRGVTFELLSLAGWFAAWFGALWLGPWLAPWLARALPIGGAESALNRGLAFALAFVAVLVLSGLAARAVSRLIGATPLRSLDRLLGAAFGVVRAAVVLLVVATLVAYTPAERTLAWRASNGVVWLDATLRVLMPLVAPARGDSPRADPV